MKKEKLFKKRSLVVIALLAVFSIFLVQQVLVSRVLCYKTDGSVDLETAGWGFSCECKEKNVKPQCTDKNHDHMKFNDDLWGNGEQTCKEIETECCFDVPVDNGLLTRLANSEIPHILLIKTNPVHDTGAITIPGSHAGFPDQIPLSEFLNTFPFLSGTVILRC